MQKFITIAAVIVMAVVIVSSYIGWSDDPDTVRGELVEIGENMIDELNKIP